MKNAGVKERILFGHLIKFRSAKKEDLIPLGPPLNLGSRQTQNFIYLIPTSPVSLHPTFLKTENSKKKSTLSFPSLPPTPIRFTYAHKLIPTNQSRHLSLPFSTLPLPFLKFFKKRRKKKKYTPYPTQTQ